MHGTKHPRRDGALIIGGGAPGLVSVARSLGRRGIPVWAASEERWLAASSRYIGASLPWPASLSSQLQAEYFVAIARRSRIEGWTLIAGSEAAAELMARHSKVLAPVFRMATAPWESVRDALDKRLTYALADRAGIDHPLTFYPPDLDGVGRLEVAFPAILKPAIKIGWNAFVVAKAWRVRDRGELMRRYREAATLVEPRSIMIQDLIPGGNDNQYSYAALCRDGMPVASLVTRRLRQYPTEFGHSSSMVETIDQPEVESTARRLLSAMSFTGIVEVEFKRDPRDGRLKLLDINPRVWRWISIGQRAGVDFSYLLYRMSRGENVDPVKGRAGVRWIRMTTDLFSAASEIWQGTTTPREYLRSLRPPIEFSLLASDDLLPAILELPYLFGTDFCRSRIAQFLRQAAGRWRSPKPESREESRYKQIKF